MSRTRPLLDRLRARDPGLEILHRAVRVTLVACIGFYTFRYGFDRPTAATYALFGAISLGLLSRIGGGARARARTLLLTLPAAYLLITLGTLLAVRSWAAALGMLGIGFAVAYSSVGGPRLVGLANGLQLLYILPCFPPYRPDDLPLRLIGVTAGIVLLAAAERLLWPVVPPVDYRDRLARAAAAVADLADRTAVAVAAPPGRPIEDGAPPGAADGRPDPAAEAMDDLRFSRIPLMERPASASAADRALSHAATALRHTRAQLLRIGRVNDLAGPLPQAAALVRAAARTVRAAGEGLRNGRPVPGTDPIETAIAAFEAVRTTPFHPEGAPRPAPRPAADPGAGAGHIGPYRTSDPAEAATAARLGLGSMALEAAEGARFLTLAVRISRRAPLPPDPTPPAERPGPFWYGHEPAVRLWWARFRANLTPRSVYFQNAVRTAAALAAARLLVGGLDLTHGFWVLLATLTLMRTTAADTGMALRPALTGTLCGAAATAVMLMLVGDRPLFYAVALPGTMLTAFTLGPILGLAWAQGTFTIAVAMVFAQLAPASWKLAEARLVDVAAGAAVGTLTGLCAWPLGGARELRRRTAELLSDSADALRETVAVLTGGPAPDGAVRRARRSAVLAEATYAQSRCEHHAVPPGAPDWQAALLTGQHTVRGAEQLLARIALNSLVGWPGVAGALVRDADTAAAAFRREGAALRAGPGSPVPPDPLLAEARTALLDERIMATRLPPDPAALHAVDTAVWLVGLVDDLSAVSVGKAPPERAVSPPAPPPARPDAYPDGSGPPRSPR
ncbi:FUSC family protein [Kitasatospora sp. NPDC085879]|uniref:FUSC family protein n=1 Tax=Kitasatospora sp. NPDC085879 TaxID=3154769 RepID=UPI0034243A06